MFWVFGDLYSGFVVDEDRRGSRECRATVNIKLELDWGENICECEGEGKKERHGYTSMNESSKVVDLLWLWQSGLESRRG